MSRYLTHIAPRVFGVPLLLEQQYASVVISVLADRLNVEPLVGDDIIRSYRRIPDELLTEGDGALARYQRPARSVMIDKKSRIAVMPMVGAFVHRGDSMDAASGLQSYTAAQNKLMDLLDDNGVRGILMDVDSGGGEGAGITEFSNFIAEASREKPVWAVANTAMCSAAYWLGCCGDRVYAAPEARVGSIGVYVAHTDASKAMEKKGLVNSFIYAGKHKVDGNPFGPLPDDVRAAIQERVNKTYDDFVSHVAEAREITEDQVRATEAKVFNASQASELGLVDGVGGLGDVLRAMSEVINRPVIGYSPSTGANMARETAMYTESDLAQAKSEATAAAKADTKTQIDTAVAKATDDARKEMAEALTTLMPQSERVQTFCEAISKGATVELASTFAGKVKDEQPAPQTRTATDKAVDKLLTTHAPNIKAEDQEDTDPKVTRLAELSANMKLFNKSRGYTRGE